MLFLMHIQSVKSIYDPFFLSNSLDVRDNLALGASASPQAKRTSPVTVPSCAARTKRTESTGTTSSTHSSNSTHSNHSGNSSTGGWQVSTAWKTTNRCYNKSTKLNFWDILASWFDKSIIVLVGMQSVLIFKRYSQSLAATIHILSIYVTNNFQIYRDLCKIRHVTARAGWSLDSQSWDISAKLLKC